VSKGFQPRPDREVFTLPLAVAPEHIDENGHVNNVVYVQWLQDAGTAHWNARFEPHERAPWSWYGLRHEIDYLQASFPGETLVARTWVGDARGARFDRFVRIEGADGSLRAQGRTDWVLIDQASKRPARIPAGMVDRLALTTSRSD
jgi:acyl-CoA thioester hydrolase